MTEYVIDASSVLVSVFNEPGAKEVDVYAAGDNRLLISTVNMVEVRSKLLDYQMSLDVIEQVLLPLALDEIGFDAGLGALAAQMRPATRPAGLSLGDRCCLALAKARGVVVLTAHRTWRGVADAVGVDIIITRPDPAH
jgi:PIN domain nuclease of toxin-antitoxin system